MVSPEMEQSFWKTQPVFKDLGGFTGLSPDRLMGVYSSLGLTSNWVANSGVYAYGKINEIMNPEDKMYEDGWFNFVKNVGGLKGLINMTEGQKNIHAITKDAKIEAGDQAKLERNHIEAMKSLMMQNKDPRVMERLQYFRPEKRREALREIQMFDASGRNKFMDEYMKHLESLNDGPRGRAAANFLMLLPEDKHKVFYIALQKKRYVTPIFARAFREERQKLTGKSIKGLQENVKEK